LSTAAAKSLQSCPTLCDPTVSTNFNNSGDTGFITGAGRAPGEEMVTRREAGGLQPVGVTEHAGTQQHKMTDNSTPWKIFISFVTAFKEQTEP